MMDELIAFSLFTRFKVVFLRMPGPFYEQRIEQLRLNKIEIIIKPFRYRFNIKKLLFSFWFALRYFHCFFSRYSLVVGLKSIGWFLILDDAHFKNNTSIHAQFATQPALLAHLISQYYSQREIKYSFTFHAYDIFFDNRWFTLLANHSQKCFSISDYNINYIIKKWPSINPSKIEVARLGAFACPVPIKLKQNNGQFRLGFISRFVEKKGIRYLLEAMNKIALVNSNIKLYMAGDGPLQKEIETFIKENSLQDTITYVGKLNDEEKPGFFAELDAVVLPAITLPNDQDGIPVVLMEAISYGLPIISTNISGIPEICIDQFNGLLIPQKNTKALVDAILTLYKNEKLAKSFSANALAIFGKYKIEDNSLAKLKSLNWLN